MPSPRFGSQGRREEEGVSFPFPAVGTAGYYESCPAGTGTGMERMGELPDAEYMHETFSGSFDSTSLLSSRGGAQDDQGVIAFLTQA
jgi:hypothetical protein